MDPNSGEQDERTCFICLGGANDSDLSLGNLGRHCKCPALFSHRQCLTRWQLQNAGREEEKACRFCHSPLLDWREQIEQQVDVASTSGRSSRPIMAVVFQGKTVKVPVCTGADGVAEFKRTVCKLFNLPEGTDFEVTFECKSPVFGDKLQLKGFNCFEAASYCAAVSAAKRASQKAAQKLTRGCKQGAGQHPASAAAGTTPTPAPPSPSASAAESRSDASSTSHNRSGNGASSGALSGRFSHDVVTQVGSPAMATSPTSAAPSTGPAASVMAALRKLGLGRSLSHKSVHGAPAAAPTPFVTSLGGLFRRRSP